MLSIVIATSGRPASLARLLASLTPQFDPLQYEILIAENGSACASEIEHAIPIIHLHEPRPGKTRIQNRAIRAAIGEIIVCLDDDLIVDQNYLRSVESFFAEHAEFAAMKGRVLPLEDPQTKVGELACYLDLPIVEHGDEIIEVKGVIGANMAFRASALRQVGLFDERLGPGAAGHEEETEMSQRLRRAGFRIGYAPRAVVYHEVDPARASRERFIRIARERGYCRTLHEHHAAPASILRFAVAATRLTIARVTRAPIERQAREERRLAIARGILDGLRRRSS